MRTRTKKPAAPAEPEELSAATKLPPYVHAELMASASAEDRTFAAQLRVILTEWAERRMKAREMP